MTSTTTKAFPQVQAVRGVGSKKGFPYYATGLYQARYTKSGRLVWSLVKSGEWHRSTRIETCGRFDSLPVINSVRHNKPVTAEQLALVK